MLIPRLPSFLRLPYGTMVWRVPSAKKEVFLTFDDGPTPEITEEVLSMLEDYNFRATFFGIGKNVEAHPEIWERVKQAGHHVGHHTQNHVNGWKVDKTDYLEDVYQAADVVNSPLFRPPYGRISPRKAKVLSKKFKIIMWTIISGDYDQAISAEQCALNVTKTLRPGDIVVFHDSVKAWPNLKDALPIVLKYIREKGWVSEALPMR
ncbi:polysaccharide deacetylase family protein [Phaeocystidibacter marisrubri]|uniref:Polysaccharide deacetylase family protein n=1 Tax=Phaeocystidibacter marisrubri TaxID=1577780 RepID=A0A6L3ZH78_9FLAO|nr:polysaccharide deacetylase family protein [Phaeocystidibacter marisrubri]KAB2816309.1 polysaccharide deacetylase family protein [Phaeocystidibacter marisrubri]GGH68383.1 polysaccharide deacetylase [Phaeocystidibacter marisrubri]